jgi:hypothetical protein
VFTARRALNDDPEKCWGRPRTSHTDENCVVVECLIREHGAVKVRERSCKKKKDMQYFISFGKERTV